MEGGATKLEMEDNVDLDDVGLGRTPTPHVGSLYNGLAAPPSRNSLDAHPDDDYSSFFTKGRDFESVYTNHKFTFKERELLASYDSTDYLPGHSDVYKEWLQRQPARLDWDRWVMMGLIGITVGVIGFLLHQTVDIIAEVKWEHMEHILHDNHVHAWLWVIGYSLLFVALSAASVAFIAPSAGGSGIPEIICFLNGTVVRYALNLKVFLVKFFSCCCAVGGGMPAGPEGPMIHIGAIVGTGLGKSGSRTLKCGKGFRLFSRFRNPEDRRNFTLAGAAAGVASAFTSPVGGLLFGMEEVSSFWTTKLGWMIFFCCMLASCTTDLLNSAFEAFHYKGAFGLFKTNKFIIFKDSFSSVNVSIAMFVPAIILGMFGGITGGLFTILNLKINRLRRKLFAKVKNVNLRKICKVAEPLLIMLLWGTITVYLPAAFPCQPIVCQDAETVVKHDNDSLHLLSQSPNVLHTLHRRSSEGEHTTPTNGSHHHTVHTCPSGRPSSSLIDSNVINYWCEETVKVNDTVVAGEYNEAATLLNTVGQSALRFLFSRHTPYQFGYASLLSVFALYYLMCCWAAGSAISSGIVVPMLFVGGLYGRALGRGMIDIYGEPTEWHMMWMDPGAFALIGAASFFAGVSRLTMSLAVIMIEITNDVQFLLPIMVSILIAKWMGDYITHPLYHSLLELKCIPFLDTEPVVYEGRKLLNLELYKAKDVMNSPVYTIYPCESVAYLAHLLLKTTHGGFPMVQHDENLNQDKCYGMITRTELAIILTDRKIQNERKAGITITPTVPYEQVNVDRIDDNDLDTVVTLLKKYTSDSVYADIYVNLEPYASRSTPGIGENFSLHRTYILFRTLGLRHLTVVNIHNNVVGIISRKDLMGFNIEEKVGLKKRRTYSVIGSTRRVVLSEDNSYDSKL